MEYGTHITGYYDLTPITKIDEKSDGHYLNCTDYLFRPCTGIEGSVCNYKSEDNVRLALRNTSNNTCSKMIDGNEITYEITDSIGFS